MEEGSPFPASDQSALANAVRGGMAILPKLLGMQLTGGSSTVPDGFERLRRAGAVARETLKEAAARKYGVDRAAPRTGDGHVVLPDATITAGSWDQPWSIPHYRVTGYRAPEMVSIFSWRAVGASGNGFLHEAFMDELINEAGADPFAERLRLCMHEPSHAVLNAVGEMSGWSGVKPAANKGRGLAFTMSFGVPVAEIVEVTNTPDGVRIDKVWVACDVGVALDPVNLESQIMGGVIFGLGHAMNCELTYAEFAAEQTNYHACEGMRLYQAPEIEIRVLTNLPKIKGVGEPSVPPPGAGAGQCDLRRDRPAAARDAVQQVRRLCMRRGET